jgi:cytochrome c oxidase subunit 2
MILLFKIIKMFELCNIISTVIETSITKHAEIAFRKADRVYKRYISHKFVTTAEFYSMKEWLNKIFLITYWNHFWNNFYFSNYLKKNSENNNILLTKNLKLSEISILKTLNSEGSAKSFKFDGSNLNKTRSLSNIKGSSSKTNNVTIFIPGRFIELDNKKYNKLNNRSNLLMPFYMILIDKTFENKKTKENVYIPNDVNLITKTTYFTALFLRQNGLISELPRQLQYNGKLSYGRHFYPLKSKKRLLKYVLTYDDVEFSSFINGYISNFIYWIQYYSVFKSGIYRFNHNTFIEIVWTIIPSLVLVIIGIPSFLLVYAIDEIIEPDFLVKCIGHQWYWSYEISFPIKELKFWNKEQNIYSSFSSYLLSEDDLLLGRPRLLEVDQPLVLPTNVYIGLLITSEDVLHSWTIPSFGVKCDAVPGRLNHANLYIERSGTFYGQCSEICGVNHAFMPIVVIAEDLI